MIPMVRAAGILALTVALAAGCGGTTPPSQSPVGSAAAAASGAPAGFASAGAPAGASSPGALPSSAPSSAGSSAVPSASQGPLDSGTATGASACSGSHDNRVFFEAIAGQVTWAVYCAVLPAGWFVQTGSFSLRDGGHMDITYKGPNARRGRRLRPGGRRLHAPGSAAGDLGIRRPEWHAHGPRVGRRLRHLRRSGGVPVMVRDRDRARPGDVRGPRRGALPRAGLTRPALTPRWSGRCRRAPGRNRRARGPR
jgi:hypothetical protein